MLVWRHRVWRDRLLLPFQLHVGVAGLLPQLVERRLGLDGGRFCRHPSCGGTASLVDDRMRAVAADEGRQTGERRRDPGPHRNLGKDWKFYDHQDKTHDGQQANSSGCPGYPQVRPGELGSRGPVAAAWAVGERWSGAR